MHGTAHKSGTCLGGWTGIEHRYSRGYGNKTSFRNLYDKRRLSGEPKAIRRSMSIGLMLKSVLFHNPSGPHIVCYCCASRFLFPSFSALLACLWPLHLSSLYRKPLHVIVPSNFTSFSTTYQLRRQDASFVLQISDLDTISLTLRTVRNRSLYSIKATPFAQSCPTVYTSTAFSPARC